MKRVLLMAAVPPLVVAAILLVVSPFVALRPGSWIALGGLLAIYLAHALVPLFTRGGRDGLIHGATAVLLTRPTLWVAIALVLVALFVPGVPWQVVVAVMIVLLGITLWLLLGSSLAVERDVALDQRTQQDVTQVRRWAATVQRAATHVSDAAARRRVLSVAEDLSLMPFAGNPATASVEAEIDLAVAQLELAALQDDGPKVNSGVAALGRLMQDRAAILRTAP